MHFVLEVGDARLVLQTIWRLMPDVQKLPVTLQVGSGLIGGSNKRYGYVLLTVRRQQLRLSIPNVQPRMRHWPPLPWK
jgi:hypothetical protein